MKKDELLDLITEFKPDDAFIEEALGEREGAPIRVYAGKRSPMRIVAPIAACLAVFVAAGFLVVNVRNGKFAVGPAASTEESFNIDETSEPEIIEPEENTTFVEKCKDIVTAELTNGLPEDAEWVELYFDIDFDGKSELLLCPNVRNTKLDGVPGYRVFKDNGEDDVRDLGVFDTTQDYIKVFYVGTNFGANDEVVLCYDVDKENFCYIDEVNKKYYYFDYDDNFFVNHIDTIYEVFYNEETGVIEENAYLQYISAYPEDESSDVPFSETAYIYGEEVEISELLEKWNTIPNIPNLLPSYGKVGMIKMIDILAEKYNVSEEDHADMIKRYKTDADDFEDDNKARARVNLIDANNDGKSEIAVRFENCEQLRGFYIFERDGAEINLIGEFDLEGKRLGANSVEMFEEHGKLLNRDHLYEIYEGDDGERFRFYYTYESEKRGDDTLAKRRDMHKIVVNEDGTLGDEIIMTIDEEYSYSEDKSIYPRVQLYGEDVSIAEATAEDYRISTAAHNFEFYSPNRFRT